MVEGYKTCSRCKKAIDLKSDVYSCLSTHKGVKTTEEEYWHFDCFVEWFQSKITERIMIMQKQALKVLGTGMQQFIKHTQAMQEPTLP